MSLSCTCFKALPATPLCLIRPLPQAFSKLQGGPLWFGLPLSSILNSVVTLNVAADSLTLVTNESPGLVLSAVLCSFDNATCGSFTALNQRGYVNVLFQNTGYIDASYTVEVSCCCGRL